MHVSIFSWIFISIETMNKTQKKKRNISNIKVMKCLKNSIFNHGSKIGPLQICQKEKFVSFYSFLNS